MITSPPYFRLRNYQTTDQIGLEGHVDQWVEELLVVARAETRPEANSQPVAQPREHLRQHRNDGAAPKSLLLAPERLAMAMVNDGWVLHNKVIWSKPNPMPTSVTVLGVHLGGRLLLREVTGVLLDLDAIRVPHRGRPTKGHGVRAAWSACPTAGAGLPAERTAELMD